MKPSILLLSVSSVLILASCSTAYKTGQTPDDLYYAERAYDNYARTEERSSDDYYEDRYLRMKVQNRTRWTELDDWYYADHRNRYKVYTGCYDGWSPYTYWNSYYNPYYRPPVYVKTVRTPVYSKPRTFNLNAYNPNDGQTKNYRNTQPAGSSNNSYNTRSSDSNNGNRLRDIFRGSESSGSSGSSGTKTNSSTTTGSSGSGSSSSGSSGNAPVRRF